MDDTNIPVSINLDPDKITNQGTTPVSTIQPLVSKVIDITPGKPNNSLPDIPVTHVDNVVLPQPKVADITPIASTLEDITPKQNIVPQTPTAAPASGKSLIDMFRNIIPGNPASEVLPKTESSIVAPTAPQSTQSVIPEDINIPTNNIGFKIDSSSPLFEDPDKVFLVK